MELWIRSQDKKRLIKTNILELSTYEPIKLILTEEDIGKGDCKIFANEHIYIGTYKTKERALEVLDDISSKIKNQFIVQVNGLSKPSDQQKIKERFERDYVGDFIMSDGMLDIKPINQNLFLYEMPKE